MLVTHAQSPLKQSMLPAAERLAVQIRALYASGLQDVELWSHIEQAMKPLLQDPDLLERSRSWGVTVESGPTVGNLLFYEDPDFGFVFNATVRRPHVVSTVHDHGAIWTLYGLIEGHETMNRYERVDGGPPDLGPAHLVLTGSSEMGPGDIDAVAPGRIHQEHAGADRSIAFIVRGKRPGTFPQHNYFPETGEVVVTNGPRLIPHELV